MNQNVDKALLYKRKSKRKYITISVLAGLTALGGLVLAMDNVSQVSADSSSVPIAASHFKKTDLGDLSNAKSPVGAVENSPLLRRMTASVTADGKTTTVGFVGNATVEDLIKKAGIKLEKDDILSQEKNFSLIQGETITVTRVLIQDSEWEEEIEYETKYQDDDSRTEGTETVIQEGVNGLVKKSYKITYHDGNVEEAELLSEEVIREPVDEIIAVGTAPEPVATTQETSRASSGQTTGTSSSSGGSISTAGSTSDFSYSRAITCTAYAYTAPAGARGASGNLAVPGTCAVDPSVIPLGTKLYIEGYGYATANDTGGAIIGNTVDVFFDTYNECTNWGRRTVTVYILD